MWELVRGEERRQGKVGGCQETFWDRGHGSSECRIGGGGRRRRREGSNGATRSFGWGPRWLGREPGRDNDWYEGGTGEGGGRDWRGGGGGDTLQEMSGHVTIRWVSKGEGWSYLSSSGKSAILAVFGGVVVFWGRREQANLATSRGWASGST